MLVAGDKVSGTEAAEIGLVSGVFETRAALDAHVASVAEGLADHAPGALMAAKQVPLVIGLVRW